MTTLVECARRLHRKDARSTERGTVLQTRALELLILQSTPFCNLDCRYCYLPARNDRTRMSLETLRAALRKVAQSELLRDRLSVVWHAGEPMAAPIDWYEEAFAVVAEYLRTVRVEHHFQTNAVLIDDAWCEFIRRHDVRIGVSVDGPAFLHDRHRKTRGGKGTHWKVMRGIERLRAAEIPFHVIAVLTRDALDHADAIFDFMAELGAVQIGFNIEEVELDHLESSLQGEHVGDALAAFWRRLLERVERDPNRLRVREIECVLGSLRSSWFGRLYGNQQNRAGRLLNVAADGTYCYWSPELLGATHPVFGRIALGNVNDDAVALGEEPLLAPIQQEIDKGVARCKAECPYFDFCLGGAPVNKLYERNSFAATETMACRLGQKVSIDAVLEQLDRTLPRGTRRATSVAR
jgi:uncharacterized protein